MTLLVLNFPSLLHPGDHNGRVHFQVQGDQPSKPMVYLTREGGPSSETRGERVLLAGSSIGSHRVLTCLVRQTMCPTQNLWWVHPHPQISRMVYLWIGKHRWTTSKKAYFQILQAHDQRRAMQKCEQAQTRWRAMSQPVASGLAVLKWPQIRKIVGLNPWGSD